MGNALAKCCIPKNSDKKTDNEDSDKDSVNSDKNENRNKKIKNKEILVNKHNEMISFEKTTPNNKYTKEKYYKVKKNDMNLSFGDLNTELNSEVNINTAKGSINYPDKDKNNKEEIIKEKRQEIYNNFVLDTDNSHITKDDY
jgi:hypothetical protein